MSTQQKKAPVQGWPAGIPWSLHLEAYAAYSKKWSPQPALIDLEGRNCRGGFSTGELDEFIPGWRERVSEIAQLRQEVERLEADFSQLMQKHNALHVNARASRDRIAKLEAANAELLGALETARDHIAMDSLEVSHSKDTQQIRAAIEKHGGKA